MLRFSDTLGGLIVKVFVDLRKLERETVTHSIQQLLNPGSGTLGTLIQRAHQLQALNTLILKHLPDPLKQHCQVLNCERGRLVLGVDSPVWSTQLRFKAESLLQALRQEWPNISRDFEPIESLEWKVV